MAAPNRYEAQHYANMDDIERQIEKLFSDADFELSYFVKATFRGSANYIKSPLFLSKLDDIDDRLKTSIINLIAQGIKKADDISDTKSKATIQELTQARKELQIVFAKEYTTTSGDASRYFAKRAKEGFNISSRVWDISDQKRGEMSDCVGAAIDSGVPADKLASEIQKYLRDPDKTFRRVRNADGELVESQARKNYHPGQGVYKSSKANAFRLSRTEINIAYRSADGERWQQQEFVTAIDVKLSNSHPECDICNYFVGRYPKDFKFKAWHPSCLCYAVPVLLSPEQADQYENYLLGEANKPIIHYESEIPKRASDYIAENSERINDWSNIPYWVSDNGKYVGDLLKKK